MKSLILIIMIILLITACKKEEKKSAPPETFLQVVCSGTVTEKPRLISGRFFKSTQTDFCQVQIVPGLHCTDTIQLTFPLIPRQDLGSTNLAAFSVKGDSHTFLIVTPFSLYLDEIVQGENFIALTGKFSTKGTRSGGRQMDLAGNFINLSFAK